LGCSLPTGLAVLPLQFESATSRDELHTASHTTTVLKLFKEHHIPVESFLPPTDRPSYVVNKHFQWLGPTLFIPLALMNDNPQIVSLALGVLSNCITDFFKGIPIRQRNIKFDMVVETSSDRTYKKISYEGNVEGLLNLPEIIREMRNEK
jgi:hypothetical protein